MSAGIYGDASEKPSARSDSERVFGILPSVDFDLSDEQRLLRDTVREFARAEIAPVAGELDRTKSFPYEIVGKLGQLGLKRLGFNGVRLGRIGSGHGMHPVRSLKNRYSNAMSGRNISGASFLKGPGSAGATAAAAQQGFRGPY